MSSFTKNTLITFIVRVITAVFGILITIIIARALGPEKQGIYSLAILLPSTLIIFTMFGLNISSTFYVGKKKYSPKEVFSSDLVLSIFLSFLTILLGLIIIFSFGKNIFSGVNIKYLLLALSIVPFNIFFGLISSILLGLQKIKSYNFIAFFQSALFLLFIVVLVLGFRFGIKATIFAQVLSFLFAGIILFFAVNKETSGFTLKLNKRYTKDAVIFGLKNYLGGVLNFLHYRVDIFIINIFLNPTSVGFYFIAVRLAESIWLVSQSAATVLFPKVAAETDSQRLKDVTPIVCRNILFVTFLIVVLLLAFSHWIIVLFYSEEFLDSVRPFQILLIGTLFVAGWTILANDMGGRGKPMLVTFCSGFSVILNIVLNVILIPKKGIEGAALATAISYFITFIITVLIYDKTSGNKMIDVIIPKKSDLMLYKNIFLVLKEKIKKV